jgi:hypothetical protein
MARQSHYSPNSNHRRMEVMESLLGGENSEKPPLDKLFVFSEKLQELEKTTEKSLPEAKRLKKFGYALGAIALVGVALGLAVMVPTAGIPFAIHLILAVASTTLLAGVAMEVLKSQYLKLMGRKLLPDSTVDKELHSVAKALQKENAMDMAELACPKDTLHTVREIIAATEIKQPGFIKENQKDIAAICSKLGKDNLPELPLDEKGIPRAASWGIIAVGIGLPIVAALVFPTAIVATTAFDIAFGTAFLGPIATLVVWDRKNSRDNKKDDTNYNVAIDSCADAVIKDIAPSIQCQKGVASKATEATINTDRRVTKVGVVR